jgi:hypothetical protein
MQSPEPTRPPRAEQPPPDPSVPDPLLGRDATLWSLGGRLTWVAGLVLMLSSLMGWYTGEEAADGVRIAVLGWHTGTLGKLVFCLGLAVLVLTALREAGIQLPASVPESLVVIAIGSLATIFVLIRLISIPDEFFFAGRGVGIWIALASALGTIAAGLLLAGEEL